MTRSSSDSLSRFRLGRVLGYTCCCLLFDQILSMWITFLRRPTSRSELYQLGWGAALHRDSRPDQSEAGMRFGPTAASERWWLYLSESETISSIKPETPVTCSTTEPVNLTGQGFTEISLSDQDGHSTSDFDTECQRISLIDFISASCWSICLSFSHSCIHSSERFFSFLFASPYCTCCYSGCLSSDIFVRVVSCRLLLICGEQKKRVTRLELLQMENVMYSLGCSNRSVDMTDETKWTTGRQAAGHIGLNRVESGSTQMTERFGLHTKPLAAGRRLPVVVCQQPELTDGTCFRPPTFFSLSLSLSVLLEKTTRWPFWCPPRPRRTSDFVARAEVIHLANVRVQQPKWFARLFYVLSLSLSPLCRLFYQQSNQPPRPFVGR